MPEEPLTCAACAQPIETTDSWVLWDPQNSKRHPLLSHSHPRCLDRVAASIPGSAGAEIGCFDFYTAGGWDSKYAPFQRQLVEFAKSSPKMPPPSLTFTDCGVDAMREQVDGVIERAVEDGIIAEDAVVTTDGTEWQQGWHDGYKAALNAMEETFMEKLHLLSIGNELERGKGPKSGTWKFKLPGQITPICLVHGAGDHMGVDKDTGHTVCTKCDDSRQTVEESPA